MSSSTRRELNCPKCGALNSLPIWSSITSTQEPKLRQMILEESLFDFSCKACGYNAVFCYPCLYHDPEREFLLYLNPSANPQTMNIQIPPQLVPLKKRIVMSREEMKEKILIFESGFDDAAIEIVKLAAANLTRKKTGIPDPQLFFVSGGREQIKFEIFAKKGAPQGAQIMKTALYAQASDMLRAVNFRASEGFQRIDKNVAQALLQKYQTRQ